MDVVTYSGFKNELEKIAYHSVVDIAGLGMLAAPTVQKMRGKEMSEKGTHAAELGGLGVLAGSSAHKIYSGAKKAYQAAPKSGVWKAIREGAKHASAEPQLVDGALSLFTKKAGIFGGMAGMRAAATNAQSMAMKGLQGGKSLAGAAASRAPARLATQVPRAIPTAQQVGGHSFTRAVTGRHAPIEIPGLT